MPVLVAECGINHNGDIELAKKLIDIAVAGGCQFVKFQKRTIDAVYTPEELAAQRESPWGTTFRQQKEGLEFDKAEYALIDAYCKEKGIAWFASPWDVESVDFLEPFNCPFYKVASASLGNFPLLRRLAETKRPLIVSTGMCSHAELDAALDVLGSEVQWLLACTSTYPTKAEDMNMNKIGALRAVYGDKFKIGFSNHSSGIMYVIMAAALGAEMIEFHITIDRSIYGSDQAASIEQPGVMKIKDWLTDMSKSWGKGQIECLEAEKGVRKKLWKSVP